MLGAREESHGASDVCTELRRASRNESGEDGEGRGLLQGKGTARARPGARGGSALGGGLPSTEASRGQNFVLFTVVSPVPGTQ